MNIRELMHLVLVLVIGKRPPLSSLHWSFCFGLCLSLWLGLVGFNMLMLKMFCWMEEEIEEQLGFGDLKLVPLVFWRYSEREELMDC